MTLQDLINEINKIPYSTKVRMFKKYYFDVEKYINDHKSQVGWGDGFENLCQIIGGLASVNYNYGKKDFTKMSDYITDAIGEERLFPGHKYDVFINMRSYDSGPYYNYKNDGLLKIFKIFKGDMLSEAIFILISLALIDGPLNPKELEFIKNNCGL